MTRNRGEGDFVVGNVDPMDRTQGAESDQPGKLSEASSLKFFGAVFDRIRTSLRETCSQAEATRELQLVLDPEFL